MTTSIHTRDNIGVALPETVDASTITFDEHVDVLVMGFGIAGGCAALEAARNGANVLVLERAGEVGGTTALAGGHFYMGGGTVVQKATGQEDSWQEMEKFITAMCPNPDAEKIRAFCQDSADHCDWIESLGFEFERSFFPGKAVIQPNTEGIMYTGNEKVYPFREQATPAPRGHKVPIPGDTGGAAMVIEKLTERATEAGVEVRTEIGVRQLVIDAETNTVTGILWRSASGKTGSIGAKSVVLAGGGFVMNEEMVNKFTPALTQRSYPLGTPYDDGLAINLGLSVGAAAEFMDEAFVTASFYPPSILMNGIIVNNQGQRFVAEDSYHSRTSRSVLEQPDQEAFLIVDSEHVEMPKMPLCPFIDGYETIEELAESLGIAVEPLKKTLDNYNKHAAQGQDPEFHKYPDWIAPQDKGPWAAYDLRLGKAIYAGFTLGGLRINLDGQVQREDNTIISGLYAAGACASAIAQDARGYASGTQLAEGSYFGRRAGRHAATN